jgi:hypothetical protein
LKATGASSVALAGIGSLPTVLGRSGDTVEIVVTMEGDCIGETRDVSQQWYEHTQTARQVKRSLDEALSHRPDVHRIGLGRG